MVIRIKASKDRAKTVVVEALETNPNDWVEKLKANEFVEHLITRNVYKKSPDGSLSGALTTHKNFIIELIGGNPPPLIGSQYGFLSNDAFTKFVVEITTKLYKLEKTDSEYTAMAETIA